MPINLQTILACVDSLLDLYEANLETVSPLWDEDYSEEDLRGCLDRLDCAGSPHERHWPAVLIA